MHDDAPAVRPAREFDDEDENGIGLLDLLLPLVQHWKLVIGGALLAGVAAAGITYLIKPTYTASTTLLPPQQQQSAAASALASLGALAGAAGIRTTADQYVSLMQSSTVADRIIDRFKLMEVYGRELRVDTRKVLAENVRILVGKKDGLITIEVDDTDPARAAEIANQHVEELRRLTSEIALTEAQQRRAFFEVQLSQTRERLAQAQQALQASGFTQGALRAEPRAAADGYARVRAELTAAEIRLMTLRRSLADATPEVQQQAAIVGALRAELGRLERTDGREDGPDYISKYREFKYQETLFDLFAKQYEVARVDESREGALIQVVDRATPPERKSKPSRAVIAVLTSLVAGIGLALLVSLRHFMRERRANDPVIAEKFARLRSAWRGNL